MDLKTINVKFGTVKIFDQIFELTIDEAVNFQTEDLQSLFILFDTYFPNEKFGYLSNRQNDYSLELTPKFYNSFSQILQRTLLYVTVFYHFKMQILKRNFINKNLIKLFWIGKKPSTG